MATLTMADVRAKFPQYHDMSDEQLAGALHQKFYSDMPQADFYKQVGYTPPTAAPQPGSHGGPLMGALELAGSGIANIPHAALHAGVDLARRLSGGDTDAPDPRSVQAFQVPVGQAGRELAGDVAGSKVGQAVGHGLHAADTALGNFSPTLQDIVHEAGGVAGDVTNLLPAAAIAKAGATGGAGAAVQSLAEQAGMKTAEGHPIARNLAGSSGKEALNLHNQPIANRIAANDVGHVPDDMTPASLAKAREPASAVWNRVANALPEGPLSPKTQQALSTIGGEGVPTGTKNTAENISGLQQNLLGKQKWSGQDVISTLRDLRQKGISNLGSDIPDSQEFGKVQMNAANALEQHIQDTLPENADVSIDQFKTARQQLAKSHTVEESLKGGDVDLQALARIHRAQPNMLSGGLKALAEFGDQHPEVSSLPSKEARYNPPGLMKDIASMDIKSPRAIVQPLTGTIARKTMTGLGSPITEAVDRLFPLQSPAKFGPKANTQKLLPAPSAAAPETMVNAGGGAVPAGTLADDLGMSQDVQAAGQKHPGAARETPSAEPPSRGPMPTIEFQGPQNWGMPAANGQAPAAGGAPSGISLADILSHGVEQSPPEGLTLSPMGAPPQEGIPFQRDAAHEAGDLQLAPEAGQPPAQDAGGTRLRSQMSFPPLPNGSGRSILDDIAALGGGEAPPVEASGHRSILDDIEDFKKQKGLADVMSQGVPEGIMQRTAPKLPKGGKSMPKIDLDSGLFRDLGGALRGQ